MNSCFFIGKLLEPVRTSKENDVDVVYFTLEVEEYRKNKSGQKKRSVQILPFEAWHTAAITMQQKLNAGDIIAVECTARSASMPEIGEFTYFRVNSFKIFSPEKYSETTED